MYQKIENNGRQRRSSSISTPRSSRFSSLTQSSTPSSTIGFPPTQSLQIPIVPNAPQALEAPYLLPPHIPPLNWSHFKPQYSGKPDEDAEAHLLRTNNWMDTHRFQDHIKVQRFCLTLTGEARLWYTSLRLIKVDWVGLQNKFRQQYSKIGNTRKQLHPWRSFHFKEHAETVEAYVKHLRQVATLLGYQELQILEISKNTLLTKLSEGCVLSTVLCYCAAVMSRSNIQDLK